jgi:Flp pilus assembly protein TadG
MATVIHKRRGFGRESGAELLELAIALPMLLVVFAAMVDFAVLFQRYQTVTNAAREGARVGVLANFDIPDVQARVNSYLVQAGLTATAPAPTVEYASVEVAPGGPSIDTIKVTVQYPHQFIFLSPAAPLIGGGPLGDLMLKASSTMRREVAAGP